jgi:hypothetical protein
VTILITIQDLHAVRFKYALKLSQPSLVGNVPKIASQISIVEAPVAVISIFRVWFHIDQCGSGTVKKTLQQSGIGDFVTDYYASKIYKLSRTSETRLAAELSLATTCFFSSQPFISP